MKPEAMLKMPAEKRRGAVTQESGSWAYLLVDGAPDRVLDVLLEKKVIGAARRNCLKDVRAGKVPRPVGPWGMLVRLKGQCWTYVLADGLRYEWPKQWAAENKWRVAWFSLDGMINTKIARMYEGEREVFDFTCGIMKEPEKGSSYIYQKKLGDEPAIIRGAAEVCSEVWLKQRKSGGEAMDLLARLADAYLPVSLRKGDEDGKVAVGGWDGEPYPEEEDDTEPLPESAFERVDVFTFGGAETLEPNEAATALSEAVRAGDAQAAKRALADGADPNVMCDDEETPLDVALGLGSPYLKGGRFGKVSREQQLELMEVLLKAGAKPDPEGREPAIHWAIHWADGGDEQTIVNQLRVLLDHGADPNAMGTFLRGAGQRPLHVVTGFNQWLAVMKLLVQRGADPKLTNHQRKTPRQVAEERVEQLNKSLAKSGPAAKGGKLAGGAATAATFVQGLMGGEADQMSALKALSANMKSVAAAEEQGELERLKAVVAFLAEAEQGKADLSDIDAICAESSKRHAKAKAQEEEQKKAAVSVLENAMKNLTAEFRGKKR